jgi:hypothetical protein
LKTGEYSAWLSLVSYGLGWALVDVALRVSEGMPVPAEDSGIPVVLFTKQNIGTPSESSSNLPVDTASQFRRLWLS